MTQTSINSTTLTSANAKAVASVTYDESLFKKAGTLSVSYGANLITFNTVTDFLIFVNEAIIPLTNKIHSASLGTGDGVSGYSAITPGTSGTDAITD